MYKTIVVFLITGCMYSEEIISNKDNEKIVNTEILNSISDINKIKKGSTRKDVLKYFKTEGGISSVFFRTYVYKKYPNIKVDIRFELEAGSFDGRGLTEKEADVVKEVSKPYLQLSIDDWKKIKFAQQGDAPETGSSE